MTEDEKSASNTEAELYDRFYNHAKLVERVRKTNPTFDTKPEDFGFVGDGRKGDAEALRDYLAYLKAQDPNA